MDLIIIAGMPASGKSTFARVLGQALALPVLEKDDIKEELFDTLGFQNYAEKRKMDHAATAVLLRCTDALLRGGQSVIIVNNFRGDMAPKVTELLRRLQCRCVLVFFEGDADVFYRRYVQRDNQHARHLGHVLQDRYPPCPGDPLEYAMTREEFSEKFVRLGMSEFHLDGCASLHVEATYPERIDTNALIARIQAAL